jgi:hypothetical protein
MSIEFTDDELLDIDLFAGDKDNAGARLSSSRIVVTRKPHVCVFSEEQHEIPVGTRARTEKAIIDGVWVSFHACCDCLAQWLVEIAV